MQRKHVNMIRSHGHDRPRCNQGTFDGGVQSEPTTRPRTAEMGAKELDHWTHVYRMGIVADRYCKR